MQKQQLYIQLFSNLLIPVLGFWIWGWSLYFILLFYVLDLISSEAVLYLKAKKTKNSGEKKLAKSPFVIYAIISSLFLISIIAEFNLGIVLLHPEINLKDEILAFLSYKELGVQQGFLLIPLVAMMAYSSYRLEFLIPKMYLRQEEKTIWKQHLKDRFLLLSFSAILTLFAVAFQFSEAVILCIILVTTTGYGYLQGKERIYQPD